jgi:hypothetical protein
MPKGPKGERRPADVIWRILYSARPSNRTPG